MQKLSDTPYSKYCGTKGCPGHIWWTGTRWAGDANWGIYECDVCGGGFEKAGHWTVPIPPIIDNDRVRHLGLMWCQSCKGIFPESEAFRFPSLGVYCHDCSQNMKA